MLLGHKIACAAYLHMQGARQGIDNLVFVVRMPRQAYLLPPRLLDEYFLLRGVLYARYVGTLFVVHVPYFGLK